jgi:hypothetical protein
LNEVAAGEHTFTVDISAVACGVYQLQLLDENAGQVQRVVLY